MGIDALWLKLINQAYTRARCKRMPVRPNQLLVAAHSEHVAAGCQGCCAGTPRCQKRYAACGNQPCCFRKWRPLYAASVRCAGRPGSGCSRARSCEVHPSVGRFRGGCYGVDQCSRFAPRTERYHGYPQQRGGVSRVASRRNDCLAGIHRQPRRR
jgi:hypothetical protein